MLFTLEQDWWLKENSLGARILSVRDLLIQIRSRKEWVRCKDSIDNDIVAGGLDDNNFYCSPKWNPQMVIVNWTV